MGLQTRNPTGDVSFTGTWTGSAGSRYTLVDDFPDAGNPINDGLTVGTAAGEGLFSFSPFTLPSDATGISLRVEYYDFKNGSPNANIAVRIRCNDTIGRNAPSGFHNPTNGNGSITNRFADYATNPKTGAAWTYAEINGVGAAALTAFGVVSTDANPTVTISSIRAQVSYTAASENPPTETGSYEPYNSNGSVLGATSRWPYTTGVRDMLPLFVAPQQNLGWWRQNPNPIYPSRFSAAQLQQACVKVAFRIDIVPAMWMGVYPDWLVHTPRNYHTGATDAYLKAVLDSLPQPGSDNAPPWGQDQDIISARRRFLYQAFAQPLTIIPNPADTSLTFSGVEPVEGGGPILSGQRFLYQPGVHVVIAPESPPGTVEEISKWLGIYPDWIPRKATHPAYTVDKSRSNLVPLGTSIDWWIAQEADILLNFKRFYAATYQAASTKVPFREEINPDMWLARYPDRIWAAIASKPWLVVGPVAPPTIDFQLGWMGQYPIWLATKKPTLNLSPYWFGPDVPRPDINFLQWISQYPNWIAELKRHPERWPSYFGPEAVLPELGDDVNFFTWFIENIDFARGPQHREYLLQAHRWNNLHGLPNPSGHIVWYKRRRRP